MVPGARPAGIHSDNEQNEAVVVAAEVSGGWPVHAGLPMGVTTLPAGGRRMQLGAVVNGFVHCPGTGATGGRGAASALTRCPGALHQQLPIATSTDESTHHVMLKDSSPHHPRYQALHAAPNPGPGPSLPTALCAPPVPRRTTPSLASSSSRRKTQRRLWRRWD